MASSKRDNYLLVAAIDFGTTYSGFAFSSRSDFIRDPIKSYLKQWTDPSSTMVYHKTSTCILFTKEKKFSKFGFEAEAKYAELIIDNQHREWYFFRRFKMFLYALKTSEDDLVIEDETGKLMPALTVFSESIRYMKEISLEEFRRQNTDIELDDIKWIITVPAIWSDPAKYFMRSAAVEAGIDSEMLTIALEPEVAALFVKYVPVDKRVDGKVGEGFKTFASGSKYIVIDAGGGTIDITAHEVLEDGRVKELIKASGGDWGGTKVDECYLDFIKRLIGEDVLKEALRDQPSILFETCKDFEIAKRTIKPDSDIKFTIRIPPGFAEAFTKVYPGKQLKSIKTVPLKNKDHVDVTFIGDKIILSPGDAKGFFTKSISNISNHLSNQFKRETGKEITTIILVGGYAQSLVLINAIKSNFPQMRTIIPQEAAWSVLRGAVIFGHDPSLIKHRKSKFTYGIRLRVPFDPQIHEGKQKYEYNGEAWCYSIFDKLIEIDQLVTVGECQIKRYGYTLLEGVKENFNIYSSTSKDPKYVDDDGCSSIGSILPSGHAFLANEAINAEMCFAETEIEFKLHQPKTQLTATYYLGQ